MTVDRDWLDGLIRGVFRSLDSETTMSYDEQMTAWEGMRRLKEAILAAPPVPLSDPAPCPTNHGNGLWQKRIGNLRELRFCPDCGAPLGVPESEEPATRTIVNDSRRGAALDDEGER